MRKSKNPKSLKNNLKEEVSLNNKKIILENYIW